MIFADLGNKIISIKKKPPRKICAYLIDKDSQFPISGATIQIGGLSKITDSEGYFEIEAFDYSIIKIRHLGYKTLFRAIEYFKLEDCGKVYMISEAEVLDEIVLSEYLVQGIYKLGNGSQRINFKKLSILPGLIDTDVLQSIQAFPGIQSINETVSNINIRSGTNDQNLILWDEIKMYQSGHFFGLISMFNPQVTQKVTLQKNGTDVAYSDGVSGSISLASEGNITKKNKRKCRCKFYRC